MIIFGQSLWHISLSYMMVTLGMISWFNCPPEVAECRQAGHRGRVGHVAAVAEDLHVESDAPDLLVRDDAEGLHVKASG